MFFFKGVKRWRVQRKERINEQAVAQSRLMLLRGLVLLAFFVLAAQLWRLQIVEGSRYQLRAEANHLRVLSIPAQRGVIYDRQGRLLVRNEPSFTAAMVLADVPEATRKDVVEHLHQLLDMPAKEIETLIKERRATGQIFTPLTLKTGLNKETAFILEERHDELPGVTVLTESRRQYLNEGSLSHILGYVGRISSEEYAEFQDNGYDLNDRLGKMGVELTYEQALRGMPGREHVEVDASGRKRGTIDNEPPVPGNDVVLTIDIDLQKQLAKVLQESMGKSQYAAAVAMDPRTGEILSMVSLPSFDNNIFGGPTMPAEIEQLLDDPRRPLLNYAVGGAYPPGSIFKTITASAALQEGVARPDTVIESRGFITIPNQYDPRITYRFNDWAALGRLNFYRAIAMSSDVYFYYLSGGFENFTGLGAQRLANYSRAFGLGSVTGVDLTGEAAGLVPDPAWKEAAFSNDPWVTGDTYHFGIGQGFVLASPMQMARVLSSIANGGELLQPRVVKEVRNTDGRVVLSYDKAVQRRVPVDDVNLQVVREGMRQVVADGTAQTARVPGIQVGGKTGTAEFGTPFYVNGALTYETHGWFLGFAPFDKPQIAVAVFLEKGNGALNAAPVFSKFASYYFARKPPGS